MNPLFGDQTPNVFESKVYINYLSSSRVINPKNSLDTYTFTMVRIPINNLRSYSSMEDLIGDRTLFPDNDKKFPVETLCRQVMRDSMRALGIEYPEYGVVAYSGAQIHDRPIATIMYNAGTPEEHTRYYATPEFHKLVKRV